MPAMVRCTCWPPVSAQHPTEGWPITLARGIPDMAADDPVVAAYPWAFEALRDPDADKKPAARKSTSRRRAAE